MEDTHNIHSTTSEEVEVVEELLTRRFWMDSSSLSFSTSFWSLFTSNYKQFITLIPCQDPVSLCGQQ